MDNTNKQSDPSDSRPAPSVGAEIREVRKARGLTLKDLSERTGRSVACLSRIERGDTRISVALLTEIGESLSVDPKWFFPNRFGSGELERSYVVRRETRRPMSNLYKRPSEELGFRDDLLSSSLTGQFYLLETRFPPGQPANVLEGYVFEGEQHGVVIHGELELKLGDEVIYLKAGDSFSYPNTIPHRFRNVSKVEAVMIWAMAPVTINW